MTRSMMSILLCSSLAACGAAATPAVSPPAPAPAPKTADAPPAVAAWHEASVALATSWPGSNTHRFGTRTYEASVTEAGWFVRGHDEVHFQGVGMEPSDMPSPDHGCTAWVAAPPAMAAQLVAGTRSGCGAVGALCGDIAAVVVPPAAPAASTAAAALAMPGMYALLSGGNCAAGPSA